MTNRFFWEAICNDPRILATSKIEEIVRHYGYITDFKQYSDISLMLKVELEESKIDRLYTALAQYLDIEKIAPIHSNSTLECEVFLNITFTESTGNLRIETPAVPG